MKRIFMVAGESSGDLHASNLIRALREADPELVCEGLGGSRMAATGMDLRYDLAGDGIMGFAEVLKHYPSIRRLFLDTVAYLRESPPDCLVLVDYPGFNIRLAKRAHALGIPVVYYISPTVWAWKKRRIHALKRCVGKMLVIFPFEEKIYRDAGMDGVYVGHPLLDHIQDSDLPTEEEAEMVIGLLPGSRAQEIERLMAPMLDVATGIRARFPGTRFVVPCVNEARAAQVRKLAGDFPLEIRVDGMYDVLSRARFCLVASGTATLEVTLFGVPMIIVYRVSPVSYWLARMLVHVKYIGIVNILAGRGVVPEYIQDAVTPERILPKALALIGDTPERKTMLDELAAVRALLGGGGASARAAREILSFTQGGVHGG